MVSNNNLLFHLSRGNPSNDPCGISIDKQVFGKSIGGKLFRKEILGNKEVIYHQLKDGSLELFDPIVPTDIIKNKINYRAFFITNYGIESSILDTVVCSSVTPDDSVGFALTDVDIAVEGVFTTSEVSRVIPTEPGRPGNPSIVLDDEYDSTNKLSGLSFKKTLDATDLPTDIPYDAVLKIWVRRIMIVDKLTLPDQQVEESFSITVNEYNSGPITSRLFKYNKIAGRVPLSNWYDFTVTTGKGKPVVMRELLPKDVDLSTINVLKTFVKEDKVLIFYYIVVDGINKYMLLVIEPNDISTLNKYVQIMFTFDEDLADDEILSNRTQIDIQRSFYNSDLFYIFWSDSVLVDDTCKEQFFGIVNTFDRISVDMLHTNIWTGNIFDAINQGYVNRRVETYNVIDHKVVRKYDTLINVEHFDDLFILFCKDTRNRGLLNIQDLNLNRNQLLYIFEKDIINPEKYSSFKNYPGDSAEVFSQRLYPISLPTIKQASAFNNAKNPEISIIISDSSQLSDDTTSPRLIKNLLDGTRYVDLNSAHSREFKIGNRFVTYELPPDKINFNNLLFTTSIAIKNDSAIYSELKDVVSTASTIPNIIDSVVYERPLFQQNIIDSSSMSSQSIPVEWADRIYKDEWITILSTLPDVVDEKPVFTLQYNFHRNLWQVIYFDGFGIETTKIYDYLSSQTSITTETTATSAVTTTGSSGSPGFGKLYTELDITDLPYVLEPDTFQPISVRISSQSVFSNNSIQKYLVNFQVYFKGVEDPLVDIITFTTNIANLSYIFVNPNETMNIRMNYATISNGDDFSKEYYIKNIHNSLLNKFIVSTGPEHIVNPQLRPEQAEFKYFRNIQISGFSKPNEKFEQDGDVTIPIILYGNGYKNDDTNSLSLHLGVEHPFDFSKIAINDRSLRFYFDGNNRSPIDFKIGHYDYSKDYVVVWLRLNDFGTSNKKIYMFYGKIDTSEHQKDILESYISLKNNIYPTTTFGAWHFETVISDDRLAFNSGKIFSIGEPVIYEKSFNDDLRLTKIDKEYMYGIAKVYKSNYFNIDIDIPAEESLFLDPKIKEDFISFIKNVANVFKPGYTEVNEVKQFGIDIIEAGEGPMGESTNKRVSGLVALSPNSNVNTYYNRIDPTRFDLLTSFNGYSQKIDWVIAKPIDTSVFKSGVLKVSGKIKSETIKFESPFKNNDYFVFVASPVNQKIYWNLLCPNRFTITASYFLQKEVTWMAFHRDIFGGEFTPDSIFCGSRLMTGTIETTGGEGPTDANLSDWYNNELLIKPEVGIQGDPGSMNIDPVDPGYSLILSSNKNINMYWTSKESNQFRVRTSSPVECTVHYLAIKNGIEWWEELI